MKLGYKKLILLVAITMAGVLVFLLKQSAVATYQVIEVFDGDTISVSMAGKIETIRLIGIDTPETKDPRKEVQCFGPEASAYTQTKLKNAKVKLVADPIGTNRDRYDRLLRYAYTTDGMLFNQVLLENGYARAYTGFPFTKSDHFSRIESQAKSNQQGIWKNCRV